MPKEHGLFTWPSPDERQTGKKTCQCENPAVCWLLATGRRLGHFRPPPEFWGECYLGDVYPDTSGVRYP